MNEIEAKNIIIGNIKVEPQTVTLAKAHAIEKWGSHQGSIDTNQILHYFLESMETTRPGTIIIEDSEASHQQLLRAARWISLEVGAREAIWSLINAGIFIPDSGELRGITIHLEYTTSGGRYSGSWASSDFGFFDIKVPDHIRVAPSLWTAPTNPLFDGDLYMHELNIPKIHPVVEAALRDAVNCFRHELFVPCLAMLTKATEGAWIELGKLLANQLMTSDSRKANSAIAKLTNRETGLATILKEVSDLYALPQLKATSILAGIRPEWLKQHIVWADSVRLYRNDIHYGALPPMTNSYANVSALLLGAPAHFQTLYRIMASM